MESSLDRCRRDVASCLSPQEALATLQGADILFASLLLKEKFHLTDAQFADELLKFRAIPKSIMIVDQAFTVAKLRLWIAQIRAKASREGLLAEESAKEWGAGRQADYHKGRASAFQDIVTFIDSGGEG